MGRFVGVLGIAVIVGLAYLFSTDRRAIKLKTIAWGLGLQVALGLFVLRVPAGERLFAALGAGAKHLLDFSYVGSTFLFGDYSKMPNWLFPKIPGFQTAPWLVPTASRASDAGRTVPAVVRRPAKGSPAPETPYGE